MGKEYAGEYANCYADDSIKMCGKGNDQSCKNYMYTKELVEVTVIDEDHSGDVKSNNFEWDSSTSNAFEEDMNTVFKNHFEEKEAFEGYLFETKVYLIDPFYEQQNVTEDGEEDVVVIGNKIFFFVNCIPTAKANELEPFLMTKGNMTLALSDTSGLQTLKDYEVSCIMGDCDSYELPKTGITEEELIVIIISLTAALIAVILIFSCALNYLRKKYKNKLNAVEAYGMTGEEGNEYDEYAMEEMKNNMGNDKFDERMAYEIANGKVMANPLVDQEGKINLAMDFEDHESEDSYISDGSLESYNSDDDEPKEVFVDPMSAPPELQPSLTNFIIQGGGQKSNPLAGMDDIPEDF